MATRNVRSSASGTVASERKMFCACESARSLSSRASGPFDQLARIRASASATVRRRSSVPPCEKRIVRRTSAWTVKRSPVGSSLANAAYRSSSSPSRTLSSASSFPEDSVSISTRVTRERLIGIDASSLATARSRAALGESARMLRISVAAMLFSWPFGSSTRKVAASSSSSRAGSPKPAQIALEVRSPRESPQRH